MDSFSRACLSVLFERLGVRMKTPLFCVSLECWFHCAQNFRFSSLRMLTGSPLCQLTIRFHLIKENPSRLKASELFSSSLFGRKATRTRLPSSWHPGGGEAILLGCLQLPAGTGLPEVDKGAHSPLLPPHIWTQATFARERGHLLRSCIWCPLLLHTSGPRQRHLRERGHASAHHLVQMWSGLLGLPPPRPKDKSGGWTLLRNSISGWPCLQPLTARQAFAFQPEQWLHKFWSTKRPGQHPCVDRASLLPIRCLPEEPKRWPCPACPHGGRSPWTPRSPGSALGACFFSLGLPGCHRLGAICRLSQAGLGSLMAGLRKQPSLSLLPKTLGDSISRKTIMKPLNFWSSSQGHSGSCQWRLRLATPGL